MKSISKLSVKRIEVVFDCFRDLMTWCWNGKTTTRASSSWLRTSATLNSSLTSLSRVGSITSLLISSYSACAHHTSRTCSYAIHANIQLLCSRKQSISIFKMNIQHRSKRKYSSRRMSLGCHLFQWQHNTIDLTVI